MNRKFTAYDTVTGKVLYSGHASDPQALRTDAVSILLDAKFSEGWVDAEVHFPLPPQPSTHHVFDYETKTWIDPRTATTEWALVRRERDRRLQVTDWTQLPDVPLPTKEVWAVYRQALRDITEQSDPFNLVWPTPP